jgi:trigger factor
VTVKEVARSVLPEPNDDFAKSLGLESFQALKDAVKARIAREYETISRAKLKRSLLDALDEAHEFELPPSLVESEFDAMWQELTEQLRSSGKSFEDEGTTEDKARAEYRSLAERRVRLGLILSEIGQRNDIKITDDDIKRAVIERARQYPGQESQVIEFYKKNQQALADLRAPVYEEKVVSFALELVSIADRSVSAEELMRSGAEHEHDHECGPDCDHDHSHAGDHDHGPGKDKKAKKAKGK